MRPRAGSYGGRSATTVAVSATWRHVATACSLLLPIAACSTVSQPPLPLPPRFSPVASDSEKTDVIRKQVAYLLAKRRDYPGTHRSTNYSGKISNAQISQLYSWTTLFGIDKIARCVDFDVDMGVFGKSNLSLLVYDPAPGKPEMTIERGLFRGFCKTEYSAFPELEKLRDDVLVFEGRASF